MFQFSLFVGLELVKGHSKRTFLEMKASPHIFQTEDWREKGGHLYLPLTEDTLLNIRNIEKITLASGNNFIADSSGGYTGTRDGNLIVIFCEI